MSMFEDLMRANVIAAVWGVHCHGAGKMCSIHWPPWPKDEAFSV